MKCKLLITSMYNKDSVKSEKDFDTVKEALTYIEKKRKPDETYILMFVKNNALEVKIL